MKRIVSIFLVAMFVICVAAAPAEAFSGEENTPTEVFLEPEQIDENTFCYRDENGDIIAYWENLSGEEYAATRASNGETVYWQLRKDEFEHGDYYFNTEDGVTVVVEIDSSSSRATAYLGTYHGRSNKYSWFNTPSTNGFHTRLTFAGTVSLTMAIKNEGPAPSTFDGYYYEVV